MAKYRNQSYWNEVPRYISWFATRLQFIVYVNYEQERWYYDFFPKSSIFRKQRWPPFCHFLSGDIILACTRPTRLCICRHIFNHLPSITTDTYAFKYVKVTFFIQNGHQSTILDRIRKKCANCVVFNLIMQYFRSNNCSVFVLKILVKRVENALIFLIFGRSFVRRTSYAVERVCQPVTDAK